MRNQRLLQSFIAAAVVAAGLASCAEAQVIYRETFGRPGEPAPTGNLSVQLWDWASFARTGAVQTGGNVNGANLGAPQDVANTATAGPNNDGTFAASEWGWHYMDGGTGDGARVLSITTEYSFDPAAAGNLAFSWWQANGNAAGEGTTLGGFQVAVRQGGNWYASADVFNNDVNNAAGGAGVENAEMKQFFYTPSASEWLELNFDGDFVVGAEPGMGTATAATELITLGSAPAADLSGTITGFGLYRNTVVNNSRFDTFTIEAVGVAGDVNGDEVADILDFNIIRDNFQTEGTRATGDLTADGFVDLLDFRNWKSNRTAGAGAALGSAAIPEPGSLLLACFGALALMSASGRGRRRD